MKDKIFGKLKQAYASLGLGDEILQEHAAMLAGIGLVTDDNIDTIISNQKGYLESLQKSNDKRVNNAIEKTKKEIEEKQKAEKEAAEKAAAEKAAADAKAAEEKAAAEKAEKERKAKEKAEKEAAEKAAAEKAAAEEAERQRLEELKRNTEIPEWYKKAQEEAAAKAAEALAKAEEERKALEERFKQLLGGIEAQKSVMETQKTEYEQKLAEQMERFNTLNESYTAFKQERDNERAAAEKAAHEQMIISIAQKLGIPQSRIDEGFVLADNADEAAITEKLQVVANNYKALNLPQRGSGIVVPDNKPSKEEIDALASALVG